MDSLRWPETNAELEEIQKTLADRATSLAPWHPPPGRPLLVAGVFVAYRTGQSGIGARGDLAWAAAVVLHERRVVASQVINGQVAAPYFAGYLALREGPLLEHALRALPGTLDVVLVNATGRDHPRHAGLALHLGAVLDVPTVGVTDRPLIGTGGEPGPERGAVAPLLVDGQAVAYRLRTRRGIRPIIVHAGWRTDPETARAVVLAVTKRSRTPEPIRQARRLARTARNAQRIGG